MEEYRSGHNEPHSKCYVPKGTQGSNPWPSAIFQGLSFFYDSYPDEKSFKSIKTEIVYEIVKASDTTISLKPAGTDEKPITRKPVKTYSGQWRFSIDDTHSNTFYKSATEPERSAEGQPPAKESASVMDKLAAAKEAVAKTGAAKPDTPKKSHGAEIWRTPVKTSSANERLIRNR